MRRPQVTKLVRSGIFELLHEYPQLYATRTQSKKVEAVSRWLTETLAWKQYRRLHRSRNHKVGDRPAAAVAGRQSGVPAEYGCQGPADETASSTP